MNSFMKKPLLNQVDSEFRHSMKIGSAKLPPIRSARRNSDIGVV